MFVYFFFFKQKTAYEMRISDWSSDVCSSDLADAHKPSRTAAARPAPRTARRAPRPPTAPDKRASGTAQRGADDRDSLAARSRRRAASPGWRALSATTRRPNCAETGRRPREDRKSVEPGTRVAERVALDSRRILKKKQKTNNTQKQSKPTKQ